MIKRALDVIKALEAAHGKDLGLEGTVEAFVLAMGLGMIGPAMVQADAKLEQPHAKPGPSTIGSVAPG